MATQQINIPDIGDFDSVEVIEVLVSEGDVVAIDDSLLTLESDKATMEIPSPVAGKITKISVSVGDDVAEGDYVFDIEVSASASDDDSAKEATAEATKEITSEVAPPAPVVEAPKAAPAQTPVSNSKPVNAQSMGAASHASPSVRAFARKLGVELTQVTGSGPKGRVQQTDVEGLIKSVMQCSGSASGATSGAGIPPIATIDFSKLW